ncbi:MAG: MarR family transcriptional regulator [Legionellales bacterium]|nr:MarR family transcriptional regulator [Legionellales bacterium]|tara:strand:+ start:243 stop:701 length:459 start_codon:yes stop_codon:yes gene_type:complete
MSEAPFGFDTPEDSPGFLLWQTTVCWQRLIKKALEPYDVSHAQFVIIALLLWCHRQSQPVTQATIISLSKLDKMTVSAALKKLVSLKLATRKESEDDARTKTVALTNAGVKLAHQLVPVVEAIDAQFFGKLSKKQQNEIIALMLKLAEEKES